MKGMSAIMIVSVPYAMTFFLFYDKTKQIISQSFSLKILLNYSFHKLETISNLWIYEKKSTKKEKKN